MDTTVNPDLQMPGQGNRVASMPTFRNITDDGKVVQSTAPYPALKAKEVKYYFSSIPTASMHRADGKRLGFVFGILATDLAYDQAYLDNEIADGNPYVRGATKEEIHTYKFRINPKDTMKTEIMNDPEVRQKLTDEILAEIQRKAAPGSALANELDRLKIGGIGESKGTQGVEKSIDKGLGTGEITPIAAAKVPTLGGIVSSTDIAPAAMGSGPGGVVGKK